MASIALSLLSALYEARSVILYHGTSTKFMKSIQKDGLQPSNPDAVYFTAQTGDYWTPASGTTAKGVYLTQSLKTALSFADSAVYYFKGNPLVCIVEADTEHAILAETSLEKILEKAWGFRLGLHTEESRLIFVDIKFQGLLYNLFSDYEQNRIPKFYTTYAKRFAKYANIPYEELPYKELERFFHADIERRLNYIRRWNNYPVKETERRWRKTFAQLLFALKKYQHLQFMGKEEAVFYRRPITFTSKHARITALVTLKNFEDHSVRFKLVYGRLPQSAQEEFQKYSLL